MFRIYANESFSKRMLGSGIACPLVAAACGIGCSAMSGPLNGRMAIVLAGAVIGASALVALLATYYWKVTVFMLVKAVRNGLAAVWNWIIAVDFSGFLGPVLALIVCILMFFVCLAVAVGPYLAIPFGSIYLASIITGVQMPEELKVIAYILFVLVNVACVGFFHFYLPVHALRETAAL